jgi:CBS domain containing-hemolysin-like protein
MLLFTYFALFFCLLLIALFAASEAVLAATNRLRLRHLLRSQNDEGAPAGESTPGTASANTTSANTAFANNASSGASPNGAPSSDELSSDTQKFIATVTIAANIPLLAAAALVMWLAVRSYGAGVEAGVLSGTVAVAVIALFQVTPRLLVSQPHALETLWWVRPAQLLVAVLRPLVGGLMWLGSTFLRPLGLLNSAPHRAAISDDARTNDESGDDVTRGLVEDLVESAQASGILEERGKELIESIFSFGDTRVHEVMIPRPDILALPVGSTPDAALAAFQNSGFSRLPIQEENIDRIIGILHVNDVLRFLSNKNEGASFSLRDLMRAPMFIPESQKIKEAFAAMRASRTHLAIIMDEFGGTAGLLTVEDILEELVGEIADEHDRKEEEPLVILSETSAIADALLHIEDLEEDWNLPLPEGKFDTVGGFMIEQLGRAPLSGDRVELDNATLIVHAMRGRRPHKIMIHKKKAEE